MELHRPILGTWRSMSQRRSFLRRFGLIAFFEHLGRGRPDVTKRLGLEYNLA